MNCKLLILLGSASDLDATRNGTDLLRDVGIPFSLRIASAHRSPDHVHNLVRDFESKGGQVIIAVAGMSAHLAGVVAAMTCLPVIGVPIAGTATAGFDSLLSMSQMPSGIPVATMGFGKAGFTNAALLSMQIFALSDEEIGLSVKEHKASLARQVEAADDIHRMDFKGQ